MTIAIFFCASLLSVLQGESVYLDAREAESQGSFSKAALMYAACADYKGALSGYALAGVARCRFLAGDDKAADEAWRAIEDEAVGGPWVAMARGDKAAAQAKRGRYEEAAELYGTLFEAKPELWWMKEFRWAEAENMLRVPELRSEGYDYFRRVLPGLYLRKQRLVAATLLSTSPGVEDRIMAALAMLKSRAKDQAAALAKTLATADLEPETAFLYDLLRARLRIKADDEAGGEALLKQLSERPTPTPAGALLLTRSLISRDMLDAAAAVCAGFATSKPLPYEAAQARWSLAKAYKRAKNHDRALEFFEQVAEKSSATGLAPLATLEATKLQPRPEAREALERILRDYPDCECAPEAAFRLGELYVEDGAEEDARKAFELAAGKGLAEYYGHRAQTMVNDDGSTRWTLAVGNTKAFVSARDGPTLEDRHYLEELGDDPRAERLNFLGSQGLIEAEWEALYISQSVRDNDKSDAYFFALGEAGVAYSAMQMAGAWNWKVDEARDRYISRLRVRFPRAYWAQVLAVSEETGLDPYLLLAVARKESTLRPALTSPAGARGLMQLLPSTAQWIAKVDDGVKQEDAQRLEIPLHSLRLGGHYLARLLQGAKGNLVVALASYNAGSGNVAKWQRDFSGDDPASFVENIPFRETRDYVKKILAYYATYHSLYPEATP